MESSDPLDSSEQLQNLDFSEPTCWCESTAHYTNEQGQEFELRVRGANPDLILEYTREVRISFELVPSLPETPEEETLEQEKEYRFLIQELYGKIQLQPELDLQIEVEVLNSQGIELPYVLNAAIDPSIRGGQTHFYRARARARSINVNLSASQNGVSGFLSGGGVSLRDQADTFSPDPPRNRARFRGQAGSPSQFSFSVTGVRDNNKYSIGSSIKLTR